MSAFNIGDRVVVPGGDVGHIEEINADGLSCVRLLTPKGEPSVLSAWTETNGLRDGTHVSPQPRSVEWHRQSREFCRMIEGVMRQEGFLDDEPPHDLSS